MTEETVFGEALKYADAQERAAYLDGACAGNPSLLERVNDLLKGYEAAGSFLQSPALDLTLEGAAHAALGEGVGAQIGPYKLLQQIGEGGMGSVYMAEQERPVRRKVALKIIKLGMDTKQVIARFEAERQALAIMDHPNIAKVFDAGSTTTGRPYFVMELVRGSPITEYCDKNRLGMRERLELFSAVCNAVQHAHQKGIIHRDIKPSNILVTVADDSRPQVRVIDFGIAKATNQRLTERTLFTEHRQLIGTPHYMSPEQAEADASDVDTRTDIYSLGVLLYELLTGTTPLDAKSLRALAYDRMQQAIREQESPRPSTRLSSMADAIAGIAANRNIEPRALAKALRGELDWIAMKCLEKDRTRRYESASGLARDVERYLADEAVDACPPTAAYRLRKFTRKNRRLLLTAGAFAGVLVSATVLSTVLAIKANKAKKDVTTALGLMKSAKDAEQSAKTEAQKRATEAAESEADTRAFATFLSKHVLAAGRPFSASKGIGINVTMIEALERAEPAIDSVFRGRPRAEALARYQLGLTWKSLGRFREAEGQIRRAWELTSQSLGEDSVSALECLIGLLSSMDRSKEAQKILDMVRHAVELAERNPKVGADHWTTLMLRNEIGSILADMRRFGEAIPLLEENLRRMEAVRGPGDEGTCITRNTLASAYSHSGDRSKAKRVVELTEMNASYFAQIAGEDNVMTAAGRLNLASAHVFANEPQKAVEIMLVELPRLRKLCGPEHEMTQQGVLCLADGYTNGGKADAAMDCLRENFDLVKAKCGEGAAPTSLAARMLADWIGRNRRGEELIVAQRQLLRTFEKDLGDDDLRTAWQRNMLALALDEAGRREEVLAQFVQAMESYESRGEASENAVTVRNNYGSFLGAAKQWDDAVGTFERTLKLYQAKLPADSAAIAETRGRMGGALVQLGRPDEAVPVLEKSLEVLSKIAPDDSDTLVKRSNLALAHAQLGHMDKAVEMQEALVRDADKVLPAGHSHPPVFRQQLAGYREHQRSGTHPPPKPQD